MCVCHRQVLHKTKDISLRDKSSNGVYMQEHCFRRGELLNETEHCMFTSTVAHAYKYTYIRTHIRAYKYTFKHNIITHIHNAHTCIVVHTYMNAWGMAAQW